MRVSIIIPAWQDNHALSQLLQNLQQLEMPADEIIVVDGSSDPGCRALCERHQVRWLGSTACRGLQLDTGAHAATGEALWFVHADSLIHPSAVSEIRNSLSEGACGGYFQFRFSGRRSWRLRWFERLTNWRTRVGVPYGDQGLFATASAYREAGGFLHQPLFEEVQLVRRLRQTGRFCMLPYALATSPRRWHRDGWWRRSMMNRGLALAYGFGFSAERLHRWYVQHHRLPENQQSSPGIKASSGS